MYNQYHRFTKEKGQYLYPLSSIIAVQEEEIGLKAEVKEPYQSRRRRWGNSSGTIDKSEMGLEIWSPSI